MAAAVIAAVALLVGGMAIGATVLGDDPTTDEPAESASPLRPAVDTPDTDPVPTTMPEPLVPADSDEPIADVARAVSPSVVLISAGAGQGSGIIWDAENGYIVTNDHVVGNVSSVSVRLPDGAEVNGSVIGTDSLRDIAVLQIDPEGHDLTEAVFAPDESVEVGQLAVAIGSPFGLDQTVTAGIVSAVRINQFGGSDPSQPVDVEMVQTDAPINPGNSGGALADRQGLIIGMNTSIRTSGVNDGNVGVGFAIPSDTILLIAERIVNGESLELGFLGIEGVTPPDGNIGTLVRAVVEGAPAEAAGLEVGDLIVGLDGDLITNWEDLRAAVKLFRPGDVVDVEILRGGERLVTEVTLAG